jgi:small-conductance mechanosensitive channel
MTEKLKIIPDMIREIIENIDGTKFDRCNFFSFEHSSLIFEVVYYVYGNDYNNYMNIQEKINLRIKESFESREIEFAFPTQTVYLENVQ